MRDKVDLIGCDNAVCVWSIRAGHGDMNRGNETSALVKDEVGEAGVYVGSFRATYLAHRSQQRECMALERGVRIQAQSSVD